MKIYISSDHAGFKLKEKLKKTLNLKDLGPKLYNKKDDYPDFANKLAKKVKNEKAKGILICSTGQGMCIAANKIKSIRAALAYNKKTAKQAKEHLNANIICLPGTITLKNAKEIINTWKKSKFKKARHLRRIKKIK